MFSNFFLKLDFNFECGIGGTKDPLDKILSNLISRYLNAYDMEYNAKVEDVKRRQDCINSQQILLQEHYETFLDVVKHSQIGLNFMMSKTVKIAF